MILAVPAIESGRGTGHQIRCEKLVRELNDLGAQALLYSKDINLQEEKISLVVLDRFRTEQDELESWKKIAPVIGIDEGGSCRDNFDFLIDILPNIEKIKPNISDVSLLPLPKRRIAEDAEKSGRLKKLKVLVSFGLEDSAGLGEKTFTALCEENRGHWDITFANNENRIPDLSERLHEYDIVFTHFGLTAFEALYAGTPVLLINPTSYHEKLSKAAGFISYSSSGFYRMGLKKLSKHCKELALKFGLDKQASSLAALIKGFSPRANRRCPVCGEKSPSRSIARFRERTYRRCAKCGVIYMDTLAKEAVEYKEDYFFEQYKAQYGRTYLEDFPNLVELAKKRLKVIKKLLMRNEKCVMKSTNGNHIIEPSRSSIIQQSSIPHSSFLISHSLLDIGCAYGAFLAAARDEGFSPYGVDPAFDAIRHVKKNLGIKASTGFFPNLLLPIHHSSLRIITLWYTIEHFQNCMPALKKAAALLSPGGILAFSTPSFTGISGRKSLARFLSDSPSDHYTIWSPSMCKKALSLYGFKVKKIIICGHHPERFPLLGKYAKNNKNPLYHLLLAVSKIFSLGDTFEVYAVKKQAASAYFGI